MGDGITSNAFQIKTLFMQEMFKQGILTFGSHNLSFAHSQESLQHLLNAYEIILPKISKADKDGTLDMLLECAPLVPLFKVR